ncbi:MAG: 30S ribosomal protein S8 [candidate division SR1 bacterium]|nr:30S ribosomal protein S8 [candidate division SR1 bacterium]
MTYINAPIHDLLIRIKNAYMARKTSVEDVPFSNFKVNVLELLKQYGFVQKFDIKTDGIKKHINVTLKRVIDPVNDVPNIKFFSKPSRPWYVSYKDITLVAGGKGIGIISTNQGLMPAHVAKQKKLGGELIAEIY